jgi:hypothetical protein
MPTTVFELSQQVRAARRSWVLRGVIHGFSEEARTRGFASLTLVRFAFIECDYGLWGSDRIASIRRST